MTKRIIFGLFILVTLCISTPAGAEQPIHSVAKIFVTANRMDFYRPWQSHGISSNSGSGAIISGNRILTNAHVVSDHTFIQVKKHGDPKKYTANVIAIGHDCDLALLEVEDPKFFEGTEALDIGELPQLQDTVVVLGYPQGGEKLSLTEGVVSRIEISSYAQSARKLLTVQIDAAINPGNSGGPVVKDGKIVGIAMQVYNSGQNIGYMIPAPIINHFFDDLNDGEYDGFPMIGINFMNTENSNLKKFYGVEDGQGGVVITKILPFSAADGNLKEGDIVLAIDGVDIGEDGTFEFRTNERLTLPHLVSEKQIDDVINFKLVRDEKILDYSFKLTEFTSLIPHPKHFKKPTYYIHGGLVFTVLSTDLLRAWGKNWWEKAPVNMTHFVIGDGRLNFSKNKQLVVLLNVLSDDVNVGYHGQGNVIISKVNGRDFSSFKEFVELIDEVKKTEDFCIIETNAGTKYILSNENIDEIDQEIIKRNNIPSQYSDNVKEWLKSQE